MPWVCFDVKGIIVDLCLGIVSRNHAYSSYVVNHIFLHFSTGVHMYCRPVDLVQSGHDSLRSFRTILWEQVNDTELFLPNSWRSKEWHWKVNRFLNNLCWNKRCVLFAVLRHSHRFDSTFITVPATAFSVHWQNTLHAILLFFVLTYCSFDFSRLLFKCLHFCRFLRRLFNIFPSLYRWLSFQSFFVISALFLQRHFLLICLNRVVFKLSPFLP